MSGTKKSVKTTEWGAYYTALNSRRGKLSCSDKIKEEILNYMINSKDLLEPENVKQKIKEKIDKLNDEQIDGQLKKMGMYNFMIHKNNLNNTKKPKESVRYVFMSYLALWFLYSQHTILYFYCFYNLEFAEAITNKKNVVPRKKLPKVKNYTVGFSEVTVDKKYYSVIKKNNNETIYEKLKQKKGELHTYNLD